MHSLLVWSQQISGINASRSAMLSYKAQVLMQFKQACFCIRKGWVHYSVGPKSAKQRIGNCFPWIPLHDTLFCILTLACVMVCLFPVISRRLWCKRLLNCFWMPLPCGHISFLRKSMDSLLLTSIIFRWSKGYLGHFTMFPVTRLLISLLFWLLLACWMCWCRSSINTSWYRAILALGVFLGLAYLAFIAGDLDLISTRWNLFYIALFNLFSAAKASCSSLTLSWCFFISFLEQFRPSLFCLQHTSHILSHNHLIVNKRLHYSIQLLCSSMENFILKKVHFTMIQQM